MPDNPELRRLREVAAAAHRHYAATGLSGPLVRIATIEEATLDELEDADVAETACKVADEAVTNCEKRGE